MATEVEGWKEIRGQLVKLGRDYSERHLRRLAYAPPPGVPMLPVYTGGGGGKVRTTVELLQLWAANSHVHVSARRRAA